MIRRTMTEDLALAILTRSAIETIWRLHTAAAEVYQIGNLKRCGSDFGDC